MAEFHDRGRGRRGELRAMIKIDIFKENHRFSEKTSHPAPRSVVGAANRAASSRGEVEMPVAVVLVQTLTANIPVHGVENAASVTLNFAPALVVATASIAHLNNQVNALGEHFFLLATIDSYQTSQGGVIQSFFPVLTSDDVVSITFYLAIQVQNVNPNTEIGQDVVQGTFMIQGFN
jgi:hypothetical protein